MTKARACHPPDLTGSDAHLSYPSPPHPWTSVSENSQAARSEEKGWELAIFKETTYSNYKLASFK